VGILDAAAGLAQFTEAHLSDPKVLDLAARVGYRIDPANEYPANYTGHLEVRLVDGAKHAFHQAHLRGGKNEPLSESELLAKYQANARLAGWDEAQTARAQALLSKLFADDDLAHLALLRT
jgi:2-methylcitrate dehydratase PrpD